MGPPQSLPLWPKTMFACRESVVQKNAFDKERSYVQLQTSQAQTKCSILTSTRAVTGQARKQSSVCKTRAAISRFERSKCFQFCHPVLPTWMFRSVRCTSPCAHMFFRSKWYFEAPPGKLEAKRVHELVEAAHRWHSSSQTKRCSFGS